MILAMFTIVAISFLWTQYNNPGIRKLAGVKQLLRNAADEMTLVLTDVESTQALSQWNPSVCVTLPMAYRQACMVVICSCHESQASSQRDHWLFISQQCRSSFYGVWQMQAKQMLYSDEVVVTRRCALHAKWKGHDADHECSVPGKMLLCGHQPLSVYIVYMPLLAFLLNSLL